MFKGVATRTGKIDKDWTTIEPDECTVHSFRFFTWNKVRIPDFSSYKSFEGTSLLKEIKIWR